jgi:hypothetical protein
MDGHYDWLRAVLDAGEQAVQIGRRIELAPGGALQHGNVGSRDERTACAHDHQRRHIGRLLRGVHGVQERLGHPLAERIHGRVVHRDHTDAVLSSRVHEFVHGLLSRECPGRAGT